MKKKYFFLKVAVPFSFSYWIFDSLIHYFGYGELEFELIPSDFNELWMRCAIFIMLVFFGVFADYHTHKIEKKDAEKFEVYATMLRATHHILNNFLHNMLLFRNEAENSKDFDRDILKLYDQVIEDTTGQIKNLENIDDPNMRTIEERFKPN